MQDVKINKNKTNKLMLLWGKHQILWPLGQITSICYNLWVHSTSCNLKIPPAGQVTCLKRCSPHSSRPNANVKAQEIRVTGLHLSVTLEILTNATTETVGVAAENEDDFF